MKEWQDLGKEMRYYISTETFPVAVKILKDEKEIPGGTRRPLKDLRVKMAHCQAQSICRKYGWTIAMTKADLGCAISGHTYGWQTTHPEGAIDFLKRMNYAADATVALKILQSFRTLEQGQCEAVVYSPLERTKIEPDVILIYLNPAQLMRCIHGSTRSTGLPITSSFSGGAASCTEGVLGAYLDDPDLARRTIAIVCGRENKGGDGLEIARWLSARGISPRVVLLARGSDLEGDPAVNLRRAVEAGVEVVEAPDEAAWGRAFEGIAGCDLVVDALLGTGVRGGARGLVARAIEDLLAAGAGLLSVDLPSGVDGGSGDVDGVAIRARRTYTLCRPKVPLVIDPAARYAGTWRVIDIGIPDECVVPERPMLEWLDADAAPALPRRPRHAHKGDYGHLLPTTLSGGEYSYSAGITEGGKKFIVADPKLAPKTVPLDPEAAATAPGRLLAASGMNSLAHCVEAVYSTETQPLTEAYCLAGIGLIARYLPRAVADSHDLEALSHVQVAACLSGMGVYSAWTGIHHAIVHVIGGRYKAPHAEIHALMLPYGMRWNLDAVERQYLRMAREIGIEAANEKELAAAPTCRSWRR